MHDDTRRAPQELSPTKGVLQQIPAGLEIFRKYFLGLKFEKFEEHLLIIS